MKRKQLIRSAVLTAFVLTMYGCEKQKVENSCRTCTARYNGSTVATQNACSSEAERDFIAQYYYAEASCR